MRWISETNRMRAYRVCEVGEALATDALMFVVGVLLGVVLAGKTLGW